MRLFKRETELVRAAAVEPGDQLRLDRRWFVAQFVEQQTGSVRITCVNGRVANYPAETLLVRKAMVKV